MKAAITIPFIAVLLPTLASASSNCTVFHPSQQPLYFRHADQPRRISAAKSCPPSNIGDCAITAAGDDQITYTTNLTALIPYFEAFSAANISQPPFNFSSSIIGSIDTTLALEPGQSAYINFTALMACRTGTMDNCTDAADPNPDFNGNGNSKNTSQLRTVQNGAAVEICSPVFHELGKRDVLDGVTVLVNVSAGDVEKFPDPFAGELSGEDGGAGMVAVNRMALIGVALGGVFWAML
jgi:hypothetical protein